VAETQLPTRKTAARKGKPRLRAGRNLKQRHNFIGFHGHGLLALIFFAICALSVLGVGLGVASVTIFSIGKVPAGRHAAVGTSPSSSPSASALVGHPIDGTIVGISLGENQIAIQPAGEQPVLATVTATSAITRLGSSSSLGLLIPGDAVIVTFGAGPKRTLVVVTLQDIVTVAGSRPNAPLTPLPGVTPTPTARPSPNPTPTPTPGIVPPGPPGPPGQQ
jgi:hypothetical protein